MTSRLLALSGALVLVLLSADGRGANPPKAGIDLHGDPLPPGAMARMGTVRWRARGVWHMAFVPGDKYLATCAGSGLSLWDLRTGRVARTIRDDTGSVGGGFHGSFAFTPDGKRVLSSDFLLGKAEGGGIGDLKAVLLLWDVSTGKLLARSPELPGKYGGGFAGVPIKPHCLALRHDGELAACCNTFGDILLWEPGKKALRYVSRGRGKARDIKGVAFTRDGKQVVLVDSRVDLLVRINVASGKGLELREIGDFGRFALAANGGTVATYRHPGRLFLHHPTGGKKKRLPRKKKESFPDLSFSPDGRTLLAMDKEAETVEFWDAEKGKQLRQLRVPGLARTDGELLLSGDGKTLASVEADSVVRIWDARTGRPRLNFPGHVRPPPRLAFSPDGKELVSYAGEDEGYTVHRWEVATGKQVCRVVLNPPKDSTVYFDEKGELLSPGGRHLAERFTGPGGQTVHLYDTQTGKGIVLQKREAPVVAWAFTPDGRTLATAGTERMVRLWDTTTGKLARRLSLGKEEDPLSWIQFTPDGRSLAIGEGWRKVALWDLETGKRRMSVSSPATREPFQKAFGRWETTFSPDGRYLFASSTTNLWIWDVHGRKEIRPFEEDEYEWRTTFSGYVSVSPDGRLLAWFDPGLTLCLYEIASGQIVHRLKEGHFAFAFAPSGWRLATGCSADASILVWDLQALFLSQMSATPTPTTDALWADLASRQANKAHRALWRLASLPEADGFLAERLVPVKPLSADRLRALVSDLGADDFATRDKAERSLVQAREAARSALVEAGRGSKDLELKLRLKRLLARLEPQTGDRLREARAVMALEVRGTAKARELLRHLAGGFPEARLTREAKAALGRLAE